MRIRLQRRFLLALVSAGVLVSPGKAERRAPKPALGYIREVPPEAPDEREARLARVAARRRGPAIIVHRGASSLAPENTLEAYAAALDYGADGCEVDVRRTRDGVLVLFHDDMLDRLTDGFGTVPQVTYYELLSLKPRFIYGTATRETRPPTFAALLTLARQRAMLLHLDVKETGLDGDLARMLDAAAAWEQVVAVNGTTAPELARDPRVRPLAYKGPGLYEGRKDMDPEAVREQLARPGVMVMVDDPRVAARELKRAPYAPVPLPERVREPWERNLSPPAPLADGLVPSLYLRQRESLAGGRSRRALLSLLRSGTDAERREPDGSPPYQLRRTERILDRAWAAQRIGELGYGSKEVAAELERQVRERSLHRDWMYHGLDGALAARALGRLGAVRAAPTLIDAFLRVDPALERVRDPRYGPYPLAWTDFRVKMHVLPALGELRCPESKEFLLRCLRMEEAQARELGPQMWGEATAAAFRQGLSGPEVEQLLRSRNSAVRGAAILECLDHPTPAAQVALQATVPWALELPGAPVKGRNPQREAVAGPEGGGTRR